MSIPGTWDFHHGLLGGLRALHGPVRGLVLPHLHGQRHAGRSRRGTPGGAVGRRHAGVNFHGAALSHQRQRLSKVLHNNDLLPFE